MGFSKTVLTRLAGRSLARLITHVGRTSDITYDPPDLLEKLARTHPCIVACWHGQFMMLSMLRPPGAKVAAMVARHGDAELIGEAMRAFDVELIRGAGAGDRKKDRGGAAALRGSVRALKDGASLVMTADIPPGPARVAGIGIVIIAQMSGRPIVPVAAATSRFKSLDTWSRMTVNLPYSKLVFAGGEPIHVPRDATPGMLEEFRAELEAGLNAAMERAYALANADITRATPLDQLAAKSPPPPGLPLRAYKTALSVLKSAAPALLNYRARKGKEDPLRRNERLGRPATPRPAGRLIWVHAASVGETNVALPVIEQLIERDSGVHVLLTTGTTTSAELAARRVPERTLHQYVPLDVAEYAETFLDHWKPDLAIFTESEIWPNLILTASGRGIPLVLMNARMSPRSMRRWRRHAHLGRPLFSRFSLVLAQNDRVARIIRFLGAPNVVLAGNLKIDSPPPPVNEDALVRLQDATKERVVFLAASTHPGEDEIVARSHAILRGTHPRLLTIIVPRHPERAGELKGRLQDLGFKTGQRRQTDVPAPDEEIFIADTIGELGTFYKLSPVAFIGGSLIAHGGQNPIEAVRSGTIVLAGPHTHNFHDLYEALKTAGGAFEVTTAEDLAAAAKDLLGDEPRRALAHANAERAVDKFSGAMARTLSALEPYLKCDTRAPSRAS